MAKQTIRLYLALTLLTQFAISFISATYVTFLLDHGLDYFQVGLTNFVFFATLFLFEIPTGAVADVFGRKLSFVLSCLLFAAGMFIYASSDSFWGFAAGECVAAVGRTLSTGAFDAWLVDRLNHFEYDGSLQQVMSWNKQVARGVGILSAILGAYLYGQYPSLPWIVAGVLMIAAGVIAQVLMKEEYFVRQAVSFRTGFTSMRDTVHASVQYGIKSPTVRFILVLGTTQFFAVQAPNMQWQPFFRQFYGSQTAMGLLFAGMAGAMIIGAKLVPRFSRRFASERKLLLGSQVAIGLGIVAAACLSGIPAVVAFLFHEVPRGLFAPIKDTWLHQNIPSKERATLVSFESISHHVGGMVGLLVSGFLAVRLGLRPTWIIFGSLLMFSAFLSIMHGRRRRTIV